MASSQSQGWKSQSPVWFSVLPSPPFFYHPLLYPSVKKKKSFPLLNQADKSLLAECAWAGLDRCVVSREAGASFLGACVSVQHQTTGFRTEEVHEFMVVLVNGIARLMGIGLLYSEPLP